MSDWTTDSEEYEHVRKLLLDTPFGEVNIGLKNEKLSRVSSLVKAAERTLQRILTLAPVPESAACGANSKLDFPTERSSLSLPAILSRLKKETLKGATNASTERCWTCDPNPKLQTSFNRVVQDFGIFHFRYRGIHGARPAHKHATRNRRFSFGCRELAYLPSYRPHRAADIQSRLVRYTRKPFYF
jgi:hypothetical protein